MRPFFMSRASGFCALVKFLVLLKYGNDLLKKFYINAFYKITRADKIICPLSFRLEIYLGLFDFYGKVAIAGADFDCIAGLQVVGNHCFRDECFNFALQIPFQRTSAVDRVITVFND